MLGARTETIRIGYVQEVTRVGIFDIVKLKRLAVVHFVNFGGDYDSSLYVKILSFVL